MKILTVDDSKLIRRLVKSIADSLDCECLEAENGQEALEVLEKEAASVDLVLLDWNMPVMDGMSCLKAIKADDRFSEIPVMMVSTESQAGRMVQAVREGAASYVTKPFTREDLAQKIIEALGLA